MRENSIKIIKNAGNYLQITSNNKRIFPNISEKNLIKGQHYGNRIKLIGDCCTISGKSIDDCRNKAPKMMLRLKLFLASAPSDYEFVAEPYYYLGFYSFKKGDVPKAAALYGMGQIADHSSTRLSCQPDWDMMKLDCCWTSVWNRPTTGQSRKTLCMPVKCASLAPRQDHCPPVQLATRLGTAPSNAKKIMWLFTEGSACTEKLDSRG